MCTAKALLWVQMCCKIKIVLENGDVDKNILKKAKNVENL